MGQCCVEPSSSRGEEYIKKAIDSDAFYLRKISVPDLKEKLESIPQDFLKDKKYLVKTLYPMLFNNNKSKNSYYYAHQQVFNEIFLNIPPNPSINSIIYSLIPYCSKRDIVNVNRVLYDLFKSEADGELSMTNIGDILDSYVDNCTLKLNFGFWMSATDNDLKNALDELNTSIYTNEHKNNVVKNIMKGFDKYYGEYDEREISFEHFNEVFSKHPIEDYSFVRELFLQYA